MGVSGKRLTAVEVGELVAMIQRGVPHRVAARELRISTRTVWKIASLLKSKAHIGQR